MLIQVRSRCVPAGKCGIGVTFGSGTQGAAVGGALVGVDAAVGKMVGSAEGLGVENGIGVGPPLPVPGRLHPARSTVRANAGPSVRLKAFIGNLPVALESCVS
jgi:hypothetical protein